VDPDTVTSVPDLHTLHRDRVVEVFRVGAVDGNAREIPEVLAFARGFAVGRDGLFFDLVGEATRGVHGSEERLVDVARIVRRTQYPRHLAAQGASLLADATRTMSPASAPRLSLRATRTGRRSSTNRGSATEYLPRRTSWAGRITSREKVEA
jgi:hypothetical protein